jgi:hypothetical protein
MSFTNVVLKTMEKQETGENYIGSFMTHTQQICGSLIKTGRARDTCGEEKYIKGLGGGMRQLQRPGHRTIILIRVI